MDKDFRFAPTNPLDPLRCNEDPLSRPPVSRVDNEIADRPGLVINDKIFNVANSAIRGFYVVPSYIRGAAQVRIPIVPGDGPFLPLLAIARNVGIGTPHIRTTPIHRPAIISIVRFLELPRDRFVTVQGWAAFYLLLAQIDGDVVLFFAHGAKRVRGQQHMSSREPVSCIGHQIPDYPVLVVEVELFGSANSPSRLSNLYPASVFALCS